ncbi:MAG TPA: SCO family protein [Candidatus Limnocylindrales bacterium]|nr:SCO family protein [Candidatus Limnocylindrales bacterium]
MTTPARPSSLHIARITRGAMIGAGAALAALGLFVLVRPAPSLPIIAHVPDFRLVDQSGGPISRSDLVGRPWVASFVYTTCPGPCPVVVEKLKAIRRDVPPQELALVSFSVDPQNDTPEALAAYAARHGIDRSEGWHLVTGPTDEVLGLIRKGFLSSVGTASELLGPDAGKDELEAVLEREGAVVHSIRLILVDGRGDIRGVYASDDPEQLARLRSDLRRVGA